MKLYFQNTIKNLLQNKKNSIFTLLILALGAMIPVLLINLVPSFVGTGFAELEAFFTFNQIYTGDTSNSFYKLCSCITILSLIFSAIVVGVTLVNLTLKDRKKYKNYILMGASVGQVITIALIKNLIMYLVGFVVGVIFGSAFTFMFGAIFKITAKVSINIVLISFIVGFALVVMASVLIPLWTNTSIVKENRASSKIKE